MIGNVRSETSGNGIVVSFRVSIRLGVVRGDRDVFNTKNGTYLSKELGYKLGAVVGQMRIWNTVWEDPII